MLGEAAVLYAEDIGGDERRRLAAARESSMNDDVIALRHDQAVLVAKDRRQRADEVEQPVPAGFDMRAVLDVPDPTKSAPPTRSRAG